MGEIHLHHGVTLIKIPYIKVGYEGNYCFIYILFVLLHLGTIKLMKIGVFMKTSRHDINSEIMQTCQYDACIHGKDFVYINS